MENADRGVVGPGHGTKRDIGVQVALALIDLPQGLDARLHELRILDNPRVQFDRAHHFVGGGLDLVHPLGADVGYQGPLLDVVSKD